MPIEQVAQGFGVSIRTVYKWKCRYHQGGVAALMDASSRPHHSRSKIDDNILQNIDKLRRQLLTGDTIAIRLSISRSLVYRALKRLGLSRLTNLNPRPAAQPYEWALPGQMLHMDIKKLGKIDGTGHWAIGREKAKRKHPGWEYLHVCVDDHTRLAYTAIMPDEKKESAIAFLQQAHAWYKSLGIKVERLLTDNGGAYRSNLFQNVCSALDIVHKRTRPYHPQTNGKAERFIRTSLNEWAYAKIYHHSRQREQDLHNWINHYNFARPHRGINRKTPAQRLEQFSEQPLETLQLGLHFYN
jgi:transposase InsO family protein